MKKLLTVSALAIMTATAGVAQEAQTPTESQAQLSIVGGDVDQSGTQIGGSRDLLTIENGGVGGDNYEQGAVQHSTTVTNTTRTYRSNGYVSNPNLTTSGADTCFGSESGGVSGPGFGISGGKTVVDENCVMIKQAKLLTALGLKDAAVLLAMNSDSDIADAIWGAYPELADHLTSVKE